MQSEEDELRAALDEQRAVLARIKAYVAVMQSDRRMRVMGDILLREIARIEREERDAREKSQARDGRTRST